MAGINLIEHHAQVNTASRLDVRRRADQKGVTWNKGQGVNHAVGVIFLRAPVWAPSSRPLCDAQDNEHSRLTSQPHEALTEHEGRKHQRARPALSEVVEC